MVNYQSSVLDRTFSALADPTRRALLARWRDPAFLKSAERDGLIRKVKGISNKIIIQRGPGKPSFPTSHLPLVGAAA